MTIERAVRFMPCHWANIHDDQGSSRIRARLLGDDYVLKLPRELTNEETAMLSEAIGAGCVVSVLLREDGGMSLEPGTGTQRGLRKMLDEARAEGMGEALEIAKKHAHACVGDDYYVGFDEVDAAIAKRQAALRSGT